MTRLNFLLTPVGVILTLSDWIFADSLPLPLFYLLMFNALVIPHLLQHSDCVLLLVILRPILFLHSPALQHLVLLLVLLNGPNKLPVWLLSVVRAFGSLGRGHGLRNYLFVFDVNVLLVLQNLHPFYLRGESDSPSLLLRVESLQRLAQQMVLFGAKRPAHLFFNHPVIGDFEDLVTKYRDLYLS